MVQLKREKDGIQWIQCDVMATMEKSIVDSPFLGGLQDQIKGLFAQR